MFNYIIDFDLFGNYSLFCMFPAKQHIFNMVAA